MKWEELPCDLIYLILKYRRLVTCGYNASLYIQKIWRSYKIKVLIGRYRLLRYLKEFRLWNPNINEFIIRSKL